MEKSISPTKKYYDLSNLSEMTRNLMANWPSKTWSAGLLVERNKNLPMKHKSRTTSETAPVRLTRTNPNHALRVASKAWRRIIHRCSSTPPIPSITSRWLISSAISCKTQMKLQFQGKFILQVLQRGNKVYRGIKVLLRP